jgi:hypothetical protein
METDEIRLPGLDAVLSRKSAPNMLNAMENLGPKQVIFTLSGPPPVLFSPKPRRGPARSEETPIFYPYEENLPLQSGYYVFVIDQKGRFRVKWGNTSSHASMVGYEPVGSAGTFRIGRAGKLAEVFFRSYDYAIRYRGPQDRVVAYAIDSFLRHPAFDVSDHALFLFSRAIADTFLTNRHGQLLSEDQRRKSLELLETEGLGGKVAHRFDTAQIQLFCDYQPVLPPRSHAIHRDQLVVSIEEGDEILDFRPSPPHPIYSHEAPTLFAGKNNFVIDTSGHIIIGMQGHHILSGGQDVGGAGHIIIAESGSISEIHLNFSGHYRPPLTLEYAQYVFRALANHPLLLIERTCRILGRKFDEATYSSSVISLTSEELGSDDPELEEALEMTLI